MKKIIGVLFLILTLSINVTCFAFNDVPNDIREVTDTLATYSILNGYDDGTFKPDNTITRAEFTKVMVCTANLFYDAGNISVFDDTKNHWAKDYITMAKARGIINGVSATKFAPDKNLTNEQAIKMIVCMLGYKDDAEKNGGYPYGYIKIGDKLGITKGLNLLPTKNATRGDVAVMVFNALDVNYRVTDENGNIVEEISNDLTLRKLHEDLLEINSFDDANIDDVG